jgi:hypothetical protein
MGTMLFLFHLTMVFLLSNRNYHLLQLSCLISNDNHLLGHLSRLKFFPPLDPHAHLGVNSIHLVILTIITCSQQWQRNIVNCRSIHTTQQEELTSI